MNCVRNKKIIPKNSLASHCLLSSFSKSPQNVCKISVGGKVLFFPCALDVIYIECHIKDYKINIMWNEHLKYNIHVEWSCRHRTNDAYIYIYYKWVRNTYIVRHMIHYTGIIELVR